MQYSATPQDYDDHRKRVSFELRSARGTPRGPRAETSPDHELELEPRRTADYTERKYPGYGGSILLRVHHNGVPVSPLRSTAAKNPILSF